jgi:hypothetical protein
MANSRPRTEILRVGWPCSLRSITINFLRSSGDRRLRTAIGREALAGSAARGPSELPRRSLRLDMSLLCGNCDDCRRKAAEKCEFVLCKAEMGLL